MELNRFIVRPGANLVMVQYCDALGQRVDVPTPMADLGPELNESLAVLTKHFNEVMPPEPERPELDLVEKEIAELEGKLDALVKKRAGMLVEAVIEETKPITP